MFDTDQTDWTADMKEAWMWICDGHEESTVVDLMAGLSWEEERVRTTLTGLADAEVVEFPPE